MLRAPGRCTGRAARAAGRCGAAARPLRAAGASCAASIRRENRSRGRRAQSTWPSFFGSLTDQVRSRHRWTTPPARCKAQSAQPLRSSTPAQSNLDSLAHHNATFLPCVFGLRQPAYRRDGAAHRGSHAHKSREPRWCAGIRTAALKPVIILLQQLPKWLARNCAVFFDVTIGGVAAGRIKMELFKDICPKTAENFRRAGGKPLSLARLLSSRALSTHHPSMILTVIFSSGMHCRSRSLESCGDFPFFLTATRTLWQTLSEGSPFSGVQPRSTHDALSPSSASAGNSARGSSSAPAVTQRPLFMFATDR